jgi:hypothetical protein
MSQGACDNFAFVIKIVGLMNYSIRLSLFDFLYYSWPSFSPLSFFLYLSHSFILFSSSSLFFLAFIFFSFFLNKNKNKIKFTCPFFLLSPFFFCQIILLSISNTCFHNSQGIMLKRNVFHSTNCCWWWWWKQMLGSMKR